MKSPISTVSSDWVMCERVKPSRFTITGRSTRSSSAIRKAMRVASYASCTVPTKTWSQPVSRWEKASVCSAQVFQPGPRARFTFAITTGVRAPAAQWSISCM